MIDLQTLRQIVASATPGPWSFFHKHKYDEWHVSVPIKGSTMKRALFADGIPTARPEADVKFISTARDVLPALLDEIEALQLDAAAAIGNGFPMSNILFNLAQRPGEPIDADMCGKLKGLVAKWDAAMSAVNARKKTYFVPPTRSH